MISLLWMKSVTGVLFINEVCAKMTILNFCSKEIHGDFCVCEKCPHGNFFYDYHFFQAKLIQFELQKSGSVLQFFVHFGM